MKKIIRFVVCSFLIAAVTVAGLTAYALRNLEPIFALSYQRALQVKYDYMMSVDDPKIVVIGGSSAAFGFDTELMESTGYKLCNIGLQASLGPMYTCEMGLENLNPGDILLVATEYEFLLNYGNFKSINENIAVSGIGNRYDMYKYFNNEQILSLYGGLFDLIRYKKTFQPETGVYNVNSFDPATGNMTFDRTNRYYCTKEDTPKLDLNDFPLVQETIDYFIDYKARVEAKGATVYFCPPPISKGSITCDPYVFTTRAYELQTATGITYLGNPVDYFYDDYDMYDGYYHLTDKADDDRTKKLLKELANVGAITLPDSLAGEVDGTEAADAEASSTEGN